MGVFLPCKATTCTPSRMPPATPSPALLEKGSPAYIQAPRAPPLSDLGDESRDRSADRLGMILLQEVDSAAEPHEAAVLELAGEILREGGRDERAGIGGEEQLRIGGGGERRMRALHRRDDVGGLAGDRDLVRKAPGRPARLRRRERGAIDRHLLVGQLAPHRARHTRSTNAFSSRIRVSPSPGVLNLRKISRPREPLRKSSQVG